MAEPTEYAGHEARLIIDGLEYRFQRLRVRVHGETGDVTSSGDSSKRRKGTIKDAEVTVTKASFDPSANPFALVTPILLHSFHNITIEPGGQVGDNDQYVLNDMLVDDVDHEFDANMMQPVTFHAVCGGGEEITMPGE